jgi:hypothetical protein
MGLKVLIIIIPEQPETTDLETANITNQLPTRPIR